VPLVRGSTAGDPLSRSSVAGALTSPTTVNGVAPSGGPASHPRSTWVLLVATVPWTGTEGAVSPPLVCSCGGDGAADE
jgi:hypothetical protein